MFILRTDCSPMEIRQLEIFQALAEELHFTRAAKRVHCVQSNVTTQIRALEHELGTPLFNRLAKRVTLTDSGRRFLPYAERVLSTITEGRRIATDQSTPTGPLLIGASESMLTYRLPEALRNFHKRYPKVQLRFRPYIHEELIDCLQSGKLDLAICMVDGVEHERLKAIRLRSEKLLFIVDPKHPLAARKGVGPKDLSDQTLLVTERGCAYRNKLNELLSAINLPSTNMIEFASVEAIKECVSLGMGVAFLPRIVVADRLARRRLKPLQWVGPETDIATYVIFHRDKWISPALGAFIGLIKQMIS